MAIGGRITWNEARFATLTLSADGPVGMMLGKAAELVTQEAKRLAPVSPHGSGGRSSGYLRSQIGWTRGADSRGQYVDIATPARSVDGAPYGYFQEVGTRKMAAQPHLRPALDVLRRG